MTDHKTSVRRLALLLLMIAPLVRSSQETIQEIEICDFKVPKEIWRANASFSVVFAVDVGEKAHALKVEKVKNDFLSDDPFINCINGWTFPNPNDRFTVTFNWKHGAGWTEISIFGKGVSHRFKIGPGAFKQAPSP